MIAIQDPRAISTKQQREQKKDRTHKLLPKAEW